MGTVPSMAVPVYICIVLCLVPVPTLGQEWCTGVFSCDTRDIVEQIQGVDTQGECQDLCQSDSGCAAYTSWMSTSLYHWEQCWLFSQCSKIECNQCVSGIANGDCVDPTTTTPSPDTTTPGPDTTTLGPDTTVPILNCPALPQEGGSWTCFPEVLPGEEVPEGGHCIWSCVDTSSVHSCSGGEWDVPPPPHCYCPALPSDQGEVLCVPQLQESGEAKDGTYCIFSCDGHPVLELNCSDGFWDQDLDGVTCS